ncbi:MAG: beta-ketoacyl-[acyl-carrier-protein] synthase family protein [Elusimicrobia bacterium]|nr:beta-ketoacyl-[acyl-carrier-protein] synthase family protein [Elusimicrobiota bacterium]
MKRRVVITAVRVISAVGNTLEEVSRSFRHGLFPEIRDHVIPVDNFDLRNFTGRNKDIKYLSRGNQFAAACALEAARTLSAGDRAEAGLFLGAGPNLDLAQVPANALWLLNYLPNSAASFVTKTAGIHGESATLGSACAASLQAIGLAYEKVASGGLRFALAGGGDSRLSEGGLKAYRDCRALFSPETAGDLDPNEYYAPFSSERYGFIPGEGGACFLLESLESALERKARIYAEIAGAGASCDGFNMTAPQPEGAYAKAAILKALARAGLAPGEIGAVSAHGTGTELNDQAEGRALAGLFGAAPYILSLKSWIGHLASACGAVELALCLSVLRDKVLPPVRNLAGKNRMPGPPLNFVTSPAAADLRHLLLENFGFGGQNYALVLNKWENNGGGQH